MNPRITSLFRSKRLAVTLLICGLCCVYKLQNAIIIPKMIQEEYPDFTKFDDKDKYYEVHSYSGISKNNELEGNTSGMTTAEGGAEGRSVFEDAFLAPLLQWYWRAASWTTPWTPTVRFKSGEDVPTVVVYVTGSLAVNGWYSNHMKDIVDGKCPLPCKVTKDLSQVDKADAVLIHMRSLTTPTDVLKKLGPRDPSQPWIMLEMETELLANSVHHTNYSTLDNFFNRTMYYRQDADIRLLHGFIVKRGPDASLLPPMWRRPSQVRQDNFNSRKLAVAFISHCKDNSGRLTYVWELQKHLQVHLYGKCGNLKCGKSLYVDHNYHIEDEKCLRMAGKNYLFFLAFENALCEDYVTEKLYNLLFYPLVPVVMGAADYSTLLPPHSYINAMQYTPQQLALKLTHLSKHPQEYAKYLEWRKYYQPSTVGGNRVLCDLCVRLHQPDFYKHNVIENFRDWFVVRSNCNRNNTVMHRLRQ
ncbi:hypothetical protein Pmani_011474 [Petrolisthes manimaculis]|uniref:Fucosyltransferase n=1 Tax=Petrolisthes manimaculis TaxID=1843537 RepID=A0AAE1Q143_9EUCA|nr:hypothetical protein Pmani_011474 [Petrolisthes manimaculis]